MRYGEAPSVEGCGDVFKHMSDAVTLPHGASSYILSNQSDRIFAPSMTSMHCPHSVDRYIEDDLHGYLKFST
jgi:hypothetical protein